MTTIKSIEEKASRYDKALERAKNYYSTTDSASDIKLIGLIFPELKESGDIRKRIIDALHGDVLEMGEIKKAIAWLEKQGNLMKALQISNAKIGELIEKNYYLKEQLEKQGEQKTTIEMITPEESLGVDSDTYNKIVDECIYGEQKPIKEHNACEFCEERYGCVNPCSMKLIEEEKYTDNVEPKFHEGDWVVYCNDDVDLITGIEENGYSINNGGYIPFICENEMRLWDITDAKVGDVLVSESTCGLGTWYCIFKSLDGDESMTVYCYLTRDGRFETKKELCFDKDPYNTKPATKEQRDTLMKAMADAGYIFDFEKKELKKIEPRQEELTEFEKAVKQVMEESIECGDTHNLKADADMLLRLVQKSSWSEEDIELIDNTIKFIEDRVAATSPSLRTYSPTLTGKEIPFLKALKDRVQPKQEWSEEDERLFQIIIDILDRENHLGNLSHTDLIACVKKLKSLRPQATWKPSEEKLKALEHFVRSIGESGYASPYDNDTKLLYSLLFDLKKLREK